MERKKTTKNIGSLKGDLLLFGGVYSNLQALDALMEVAKQMNFSPNQIICTGDVVAYCSQPEEVVQEIKNWGIHSIAGNVEIQLREGQDDCGCDFREGSRCDIFSRHWYPKAQKMLSESSIEWMHELPDFLEFDFYGKKCSVVHGSFFETSEYVFQSTDWQVKENNFLKNDSELIVGGHCGLPFSQIKNNKYWLNPGVIGMPANDGNTQVWYMILKNENGSIKVEHHPLKYDFQLASRMMNESNFPEEYAKTLVTGIWDNCDILPSYETNNQGVPIAFDLENF